MTNIPGTDLDVFPLNLGGNVFGWTADETQSLAVLDAYAAGGGNFIDTADAYSAWVPGHTGGESEAIIGRWLAVRGNRDDIVIATKVSAHPKFTGLGRDTIKAAAEASLKRLQVDHIDLYWAHYDDPNTPIEETLGAFGELIDEGKVRYIGASNFSGERLSESLAVATREGLARYIALQPNYNLVDREGFEHEFAPIAARENLAVFPYFALAMGFLTGKYRGKHENGEGSPRAQGALKHFDDRGKRVLAALDEVAAAHNVPVASVALAWLRVQPTVVAPIASARNVEQLPALLQSATLELTDDQLQKLTGASS
jgi:aryl-alcohol dehydrogenase-like predicted oxidoreductase